MNLAITVAKIVFILRCFNDEIKFSLKKWVNQVVNLFELLVQIITTAVLLV